MTVKSKKIEFVTSDPEQTVASGQKLAGTLKNGDLVALSGPLGAGKTCFIKGIAVGLGVKEDDVKSPSYTLVNEYPTDQPLFHFDLYRLKDATELYGIGWDEYLMRNGIVVVEWSEKAEAQLPAKRIQVDIEILSETDRRIEIEFLE